MSTTVKPRVAEIARHASDIFDVPLRDIISPSRFPEHLAARQAVCFVAMEHGWGPNAVGRAVGSDHSTVSHAFKRVRHLTSHDERFAEKVNALLERAPVRVVMP